VLLQRVTGGLDGASLAEIGEERLQRIAISDFRTAESGELEPDHEESLEGEVPREVVKDDAESKALKEVEETKHDPISQPLYVILSPW